MVSKTPAHPFALWCLYVVYAASVLWLAMTIAGWLYRTVFSRRKERT